MVAFSMSALIILAESQGLISISHDAAEPTNSHDHSMNIECIHSQSNNVIVVGGIDRTRLLHKITRDATIARGFHVVIHIS
jgi:hypothetical protein